MRPPDNSVELANWPSLRHACLIPWRLRSEDTDIVDRATNTSVQLNDLQLSPDVHSSTPPAFLVAFLPSFFFLGASHSWVRICRRVSM